VGLVTQVTLPVVATSKDSSIYQRIVVKKQLLLMEQEAHKKHIRNTEEAQKKHIVNEKENNV